MSVAVESAQAFRGVVVQGARQVGKSTLVELIATEIGADVVSLDREEYLNAALDDPNYFLGQLGEPAVVDEVQRGGDRLILALKRRLDQARRPGRYVLTGSSNFLTMPTISESLAGRVDIVTLWPLSVGEITGGRDDFVDRGFSAPAELTGHRGPTPGRSDYVAMLCRGGYPEVQRLNPPQRRRWFERYVETVLRREVETAADLRRFDALLTMARLLIARTGSELTITSLASELGLDRETANQYEPWIETTFLVHRVPAWSRNVSAKIVKRPKLFASDTGLAAAVSGKDERALLRPTDPALGGLIESFVIGEMAKQLTWARTPARLYHYRDRDGDEVDAVVEASDGRVLAIEVKSSSVPRRGDAGSIARLRDRLDRVGDDFVAGVVFHTGDQRVRLGDRIIGLPVADLWT